MNNVPIADHANKAVKRRGRLRLLALCKAVLFNDYHFGRKYKRRVRIIRSAVEARRLV